MIRVFFLLLLLLFFSPPLSRIYIDIEGDPKYIDTLEKKKSLVIEAFLYQASKIHSNYVLIPYVIVCCFGMICIGIVIFYLKIHQLTPIDNNPSFFLGKKKYPKVPIYSPLDIILFHKVLWKCEKLFLLISEILNLRM